MEKTIAWSYELLTAGEALLFRQLSVFRGGFTVSAVEAVCASAEVEEHAALELLDSLVAKSLVRQASARGRLSLLQTLREYALDKLEGQGDAHEMRWRHATYHLSLAEAEAPRLHTYEVVASLDRLDPEIDNMRAALGEFEERRGPEMLRLVAALWWYWTLRGQFREGRRWLEAAPMDDAGLDPDLRAAALTAAASTQIFDGDFQTATRTATELDALAPLCRRTAQWRGWAALLTAFTSVDRPDLARPLAERAIDNLTQSGDPWVRGLSLTILGEVARSAGDLQSATAHYARARELFAVQGDSFWLSMIHLNLGQCAVQLGATEEAVSSLAEVFALARGIGNDWMIAYCSVVMAAAAAGSRRAIEAALLIGAGSNWLEQRGWQLQPLERLLADKARDSAHAELGDQQFALLVEIGRGLSPAQATERFLAGDLLRLLPRPDGHL